jgi:hypothetical protein
MSRFTYIARAGQPTDKEIKASYYDGGLGLIHMPESCTVTVEDKAPEYTGLHDAEGRPLYRVPETVRVGFHGCG